MSAERYPLSWPAGWPRTPYGARRQAAFSKRRAVQGGYPMKERLNVSDGLHRLTSELRRLGARDAIISSNLQTRLDGLPYASQPKLLSDPGVAVTDAERRAVARGAELYVFTQTGGQPFQPISLVVGPEGGPLVDDTLALKMGVDRIGGGHGGETVSDRKQPTPWNGQQKPDPPPAPPPKQPEMHWTGRYICPYCRELAFKKREAVDAHMKTCPNNTDVKP